jgi:hypothetical protein
MPIDPKAAATAVAAVSTAIETLDHDTMNAVVGVAQALGELTNAVAHVNASLGERKFQQAADLGYGSVSAGFIFLQRTLGELNSLEGRKAVIVQDLARSLDCSYEEIAPYVDAVMQSMKPRPPAP